MQKILVHHYKFLLFCLVNCFPLLLSESFIINQTKKFISHTDTINNLIVNDKNSNIISGGYDGKCIIWNSKNTDIIQTFAGNKEEKIHAITSLAIKDNNLLVGSTNHDVLKINLNNFEETTYKFHKDYVIKVAFIKNSSLFLSSSYDNKIYLYDFDKIKFEFYHPGKVDFFSEFSDGHLVSISNNIIFIWDLNSGKKIKVIKLDKEKDQIITSLSANKNFFVTGHSNGDLKIWNLHDNEVIYKISRPSCVLVGHSCTFLEFIDDDWILASYLNMCISLNIKTGEQKNLLSNMDKIHSIKISYDKRFCLIGTDKVYLWDLQNGNLIWQSEKNNFSIKALTFLTNNIFLVAMKNIIYSYEFLYY